MNERITAIESAIEILWTARIKAHRINEFGHTFLCHAMEHLNNELRQMVAEEAL